MATQTMREVKGFKFSEGDRVLIRVPGQHSYLGVIKGAEVDCGSVLYKVSNRAGARSWEFVFVAEEYLTKVSE